jgi:putative nucleotidyltransferase with HDIG domain
MDEQIDLMERKETSRALKKMNRRLANILECIDEAFLSLDRHWRITYLNSKAEQILRQSRDCLLQKILWEAFPILTTTEVFHQFQRAMNKQTPVDFEVCFLEHDLALRVRAFPSQDGLSVYSQNIADRKRAEEALQRSVRQLQINLDGIVKAMALTVELRDPYTASHQRRVSVLACAIAREIRLPDAQIEGIRIAGLLHDIGKISVPTEILNKPSRLSSAEFSIIQTHPQIGYSILQGIEFETPVALVALQHHERLDGSGYPTGLRGEETILEARIMSVADVVEAMASHRPYRPALGIEMALEEVLGHKGERYDSDSVDACLTVFTKNGFDFEQLMKLEEEKERA